MRRFMTRTQREKYFARGLMIPDEAWAAYNTRLPARLDVGEQAHAYYSREAVEKNLRENPYQHMYGAAGTATGSAPDSRPIRHPGTEKEKP